MPEFTLPTVTVYANPPNADPFWGTGGPGTAPVMPPPGSPPMNIVETARHGMLNGQKVFQACELPNPQLALEEFCKGISGRPSAQAFGQLRAWGEFSKYYATNWQSVVGASQAGLNTPQAQTPDFLAQMAGLFLWQQSTAPIGTFPNAWYGTPLLPLGAIAHWIVGGGQEISMPVQGLNLTIVPSRLNAEARAFLKKPRPVGTEQVSIPFSHNTWTPILENGWAAGTVGRVSGTMSGIIVTQADGTYIIDVNYALNPDRYDADKSHRRWYEEALTDFLRWIGETFGHTDFTITFTGVRQLIWRGQLDANGVLILP